MAIYGLAYVLAILALEQAAPGLDVYVMLPLAAAPVAVLAVLLQWRDTRDERRAADERVREEVRARDDRLRKSEEGGR